MIKNLYLNRFLSSVLMVALLGVLVGPLDALALGMTLSKDTATRTEVGVTADHVLTFTMPTGVGFDTGGTQDGFQFDFPASFTFGGTWANADFAFTDSTGSRTIEGTAQGAGLITCTSATAENVCVAVDTTNKIFTVKPSAGTFTGTTTGSAVTFTILGTGAGGTLTNPGSVAATNIDFLMCDEQAGCFGTFVSTHSSQVAFAIADSDQVGVSATVNSTLSFDIDTAVTDTDSDAPYTVALGTITTTDTRVSGGSDGIKYIWADLDTNASGGMVVTVQNANGTNGLVSTEVSGDNINSASAPVVDGSENYGLCVVSVTESSGTGLEKAGGYTAGTCDADTEGNDVIALSTTPAAILNTTSDPIGGGRAQIAVQASIDGATIAHADYTDTLTFIATGTF